MSRQRYSVLVLLAATLALVSCRRLEPNYCATAHDHSCLELDASNTCGSDHDCSGTTAVCDVNATKTCVQCTSMEASACIGTSPVCGMDKTCQACTAHAQCGASNVCLPTGACADAMDVAYVDPMTVSDNGTCTKASPCSTITKALMTAKPYVKVHGTVDEHVIIDIAGKVTLLADPGAKLTRTSNGLLLEIRGASQVEIYDLEITGASGMNNPGISMQLGNTATLTLTRAILSNNAGGGISANGGTLTINQSMIGANTGGGISITGSQYELTNNFIVNNGSPANTFGGVQISQIGASGMHTFEFNTVTGNTAMSTNTAGVVCSLVGVPLTFTNSIAFRNTSPMQVEGSNCLWTYSDIGPTAVTGSGNVNADPMFVDTTQNNFHLMPGSPARRAANPSTDLTGLAAHDIDGDPRTSPADMGADQVK
jgi:hypothetical protein